MSSKLRIGLVGAGPFSVRSHIPILKARKDAELTAICRRDAEKRRMIMDRFSIPQGYGEYEEMLDKESLDAVVVATPHHLHHPQAKVAIERGLHVLLEKPMTIDTAGALELLSLAKRAGIVFAVGYNRRTDNRYRRAKEIIEHGGIGDVRYAEGRIQSDIRWVLAGEMPVSEADREKWWPDTDKPNFRHDPKEIGGGFLADGGTHAVDCTAWLVGRMPLDVVASMSKGGLDVEVRTSLSIRFEGDALATVVSSGDTVAPDRYQTIVVGSDGFIGLSFEDFDYFRNGRMADPGKIPSATTVTDNFVEAILGTSELFCRAETAVTAVRLVEAAYESDRTGRRITVA
jgi:predicted dehydrogenase